MTGSRRRGTLVPAAVLWSTTLFLLGTVGCASRIALPLPARGEAPTQTVATAWPSTLMAAYDAIADGRYDEADRALSDFAAAYQGTAEAVEAAYWRAVVALDPANGRASAREAATLLSRYLESRLPLTHRAEAAVLRRLASSVAETQRVGTVTRPAPSADARDAEVQRLRQELEETKAELERIRKRLAPPAAGTPPPATPPPPRRSGRTASSQPILNNSRALE
jgi:hypothetical protein